MTRRRAHSTLITTIGIAAFVASIGARAQAPPRPAEASIDSSPTRLAIMRHHFTEVSRIHEAVTRGDLAAVRTPAEALARMETPPKVPVEARNFVAAIRASGRRTADARTLADAATETVAMLRECAECHRAVNIRPVPITRVTPDVGGLVGHMLEHQRASDELLHGLVIPSDSQWQTGAERLRTAPLRRSDLPVNARLASQLQKFDATVHDIAEQAVVADTPSRRAATYVRLLTTCADCHSVHKEVWGPDSGRR